MAFMVRGRSASDAVAAALAAGRAARRVAISGKPLKRLLAEVLATVAAALAAPMASGASARQPPTPDASAVEESILVTARKREEMLTDVPVAVSVVSGESAERRGVTAVREVAALVPGLNVTSDGSGRAFIAMRGVGVTIVQTVQPGVGLFVDGIYKPNTSYLNNPVVDIERIEVLRGPQGTLFGRDTLGGAINVISRRPDDELRARGIARYAGPDQSWLVAGSVSGPIVPDRLQARIAVARRGQDGFLTNPILSIDANPLDTRALEGTVRFRPGGDVSIILNAHDERVSGVNTPYARVSGPRDYSRLVQFNTANRVEYLYRGANLRLEAPVEALATSVTLIGAYDARDGRTSAIDGDLGPSDIVRQAFDDELRSRTLELRFDTELGPSFDMLVGFYLNREAAQTRQAVLNVPSARTNQALNRVESDIRAIYATLFWRPLRAWEVTAGLRYTDQDRDATGGAVIAGTLVAFPPASIRSEEVLPRLSATRHWSDRFMSYASVARGFRGGGFNSPLAPQRTYQGDSVWTYEVGTRFHSPDGRIYASGAVFYNDYRDYIGVNSVAPSAAGGFVTIDLNTGDVESYGVEIEAQVQLVEDWKLTASATYAHARLTDTDPYTAVTGRRLASHRLPFQPDWNASLYSDYEVRVGDGRLTWTLGLVAKGRRLAASLNESVPTILDEYLLVNAAMAYLHGPIEISLFADNLLNADYFESYVEQTSLALAGVPPSDLGLVGDSRRVGARARVTF